MNNLFSENIEGTAVDKSGSLYVINYKKGTIGLVNLDDSANCYCEDFCYLCCLGFIKSLHLQKK